jgi:hypothetical protein
VWNGKIASIAHSEVGALAYVVGRYVYQKMAEAEKANANTATLLEQMTARLRSLVLACESGKLVFSTEFSHWDMASFLAESRAALATQPLADS